MHAYRWFVQRTVHVLFVFFIRLSCEPRSRSRSWRPRCSTDRSYRCAHQVDRWSSKRTVPAAASQAVCSTILSISYLPANFLFSVSVSHADIVPKYHSLARLALQVPCYSKYVYFVGVRHKDNRSLDQKLYPELFFVFEIESGLCLNIK